ncbi:uncharacterized protein AMSG_11677 [Thecamonas trahens ATCC 50062]|uniref:Uncharacterized protein n=1 Tax=Thecamonas trahens ATCC 50062 TaxID=461836 RepID=A0A0L0DTN6_THETB|nr:hypothetical protein AMSG_11677 [Thecamonas trahens ATCC 50062]KNC55694.1 hypothetical protein AMSG_11677 [Thecamonas trahens ATCC 50062]|eukprot:XP_013761483.1 hypothetical protein AMSG_11677 [Thecamonas trahens ATCC 50062]
MLSHHASVAALSNPTAASAALKHMFACCECTKCQAADIISAGGCYCCSCRFVHNIAVPDVLPLLRPLAMTYPLEDSAVFDHLPHPGSAYVHHVLKAPKSVLDPGLVVWGFELCETPDRVLDLTPLIFGIISSPIPSEAATLLAVSLSDSGVTLAPVAGRPESVVIPWPMEASELYGAQYSLELELVPVLSPGPALQLRSMRLCRSGPGSTASLDKIPDTTLDMPSPRPTWPVPQTFSRGMYMTMTVNESLLGWAVTGPALSLAYHMTNLTGPVSSAADADLCVCRCHKPDDVLAHHFYCCTCREEQGAALSDLPSLITLKAVHSLAQVVLGGQATPLLEGMSPRSPTTPTTPTTPMSPAAALFSKSGSGLLDVAEPGEQSLNGIALLPRRPTASATGYVAHSLPSLLANGFYLRGAGEIEMSHSQTSAPLVLALFPPATHAIRDPRWAANAAKADPRSRGAPLSVTVVLKQVESRKSDVTFTLTVVSTLGPLEVDGEASDDVTVTGTLPAADAKALRLGILPVTIDLVYAPGDGHALNVGLNGEDVLAVVLPVARLVPIAVPALLTANATNTLARSVNVAELTVEPETDPASLSEAQCMCSCHAPELPAPPTRARYPRTVASVSCECGCHQCVVRPESNPSYIGLFSQAYTVHHQGVDESGIRTLEKMLEVEASAATAATMAAIEAGTLAIASHCCGCSPPCCGCSVLTPEHMPLLLTSFKARKVASQLALVGAASLTANVIRLTSDEIDAAGAVWLRQPRIVGRGFLLEFEVRLAPSLPATPGSGVTAFIQADAAGSSFAPAPGSGPARGLGLRLETSPATASRGAELVVEMYEPQCGGVPIEVARASVDDHSVLGSVLDGDFHAVHVEYIGTNALLVVELDYDEVARVTLPRALLGAELSNETEKVSYPAFVLGFAASNPETSASTHDVGRWTFTVPSSVLGGSDGCVCDCHPLFELTSTLPPRAFAPHLVDAMIEHCGGTQCGNCECLCHGERGEEARRSGLALAAAVSLSELAAGGASSPYLATKPENVCGECACKGVTRPTALPTSYSAEASLGCCSCRAHLGRVSESEVARLLSSVELPFFDETYSLLSLCGVAAVDESSVLLLTPATPPATRTSSVGACWVREPRLLTDGFELHFEFSIRTMMGSIPGDGFALVLQSDPAGPLAEGRAGDGNGYAGIRNAIALEFDVYHHHHVDTGVPRHTPHISLQVRQSPDTPLSSHHDSSLALFPDAPSLLTPHKQSVGMVVGPDGHVVISLNERVILTADLPREALPDVGFVGFVGSHSSLTHSTFAIHSLSFEPMHGDSDACACACHRLGTTAACACNCHASCCPSCLVVPQLQVPGFSSPLLAIKGSRIVFKRSLQWEACGARLEDTDRLNKLVLDGLASLLARSPHTRWCVSVWRSDPHWYDATADHRAHDNVRDAEGEPVAGASNMDLCAMRAATVVASLVERGVAADRLEGRGAGSDARGGRTELAILQPAKTLVADSDAERLADRRAAKRERETAARLREGLPRHVCECGCHNEWEPPTLAPPPARAHACCQCALRREYSSLDDMPGVLYRSGPGLVEFEAHIEFVACSAMLAPASLVNERLLNAAYHLLVRYFL